METLITIDFDIIMWPSIELYNKFSKGDEDTFSEVEEEFPIIKYSNADLKLYEQLTNYILKAKHAGAEIEFISSHEEVLNYIDTPCQVINIDHHHDLGYNFNQWNDDILVCANWVYKGFQQKKITNYFWIGDVYSEPYTLQEKYSIIETVINTLNFNELILPKKLIICSSYSWIPNNIRPLYELWKDLIKGESND